MKQVYKSYHPNGKLSQQGYYKIINGEYKKFGRYKQWYENGQSRTQEYYENDKITGYFKVWYENGQLNHYGFFKNEKLEGIFKSFYENGKLASTSYYTNGEKNGMHKFWYENSLIKIQCCYINNLLDGEYKEWYENGTIRKEYYYKQGKIIKGKTWYTENILNSEELYDDNGMLQKQKIWYYNGDLKSNYVSDGESKTWHENGKIHSIQYCKNNILLDLKEWDPSGKLLHWKSDTETKYWYDNGNLDTHIIKYKTYEIYKFFWENGKNRAYYKLEYQYHPKPNLVLEGPKKEWNINGKPTLQDYYIDDKVIDCNFTKNIENTWIRIQKKLKFQMYKKKYGFIDEYIHKNLFYICLMYL